MLVASNTSPISNLAIIGRWGCGVSDGGATRGGTQVCCWESDGVRVRRVRQPGGRIRGGVMFLNVRELAGSFSETEYSLLRRFQFRNLDPFKERWGEIDRYNVGIASRLPEG